MTDDDILRRAAEIQEARAAAAAKKFTLTVPTEEQDRWSGMMVEHKMEFNLTESEARSILRDLQNQFTEKGIKC